MPPYFRAFCRLIHLTPLRCLILLIGIVAAIFLSQLLAEVREEFEAARQAQMPEPEKNK